MNSNQQDIILNIENLTCGYWGKPIVKDFNLQVCKGEIVAITGPNGCGKSTLLKAIYQLCKIDPEYTEWISNRSSFMGYFESHNLIEFKGISLNSKTPEQIKRLGIAYFMQKNAIFTMLSVKENLYLSLNGKNTKEKEIKLEEMINYFSIIGDMLNKPAGLLSGGQRQQLAMAMLISQDADLWLLDEPTAGLDNEKSAIFVELLKNYGGKTADNPKTIIFVEHKTNIINKLANRIVKLKN